MPKTIDTPPSPAASEPVGTPPHGGRWSWDAQAAAWQLIPESEAPAAAAADPTTAPE